MTNQQIVDYYDGHFTELLGKMTATDKLSVWTDHVVIEMSYYYNLEISKFCKDWCINMYHSGRRTQFKSENYHEVVCMAFKWYVEMEEDSK